MNLSEQRMQFILTLRSNGVSDKAVLAAMETTPRDAFLEGVFKGRAYANVPLPIGRGQTISQPSVVAKMTEALELNSRCKVLEVGTGSGYQAAILSKLARRVYTIERHRPLARAAQDTESAKRALKDCQAHAARIEDTLEIMNELRDE